MTSTIDLNKALGSRATITIEPEESAEAHTARIKKENRQAIYNLVKDYVVLTLVCIALVGLSGLLIYELFFDSSATPDSKKWAQTALASLFSGSVSFFLGQMSAKKAS